MKIEVGDLVHHAIINKTGRVVGVGEDVFGEWVLVDFEFFLGKVSPFLLKVKISAAVV